MAMSASCCHELLSLLLLAAWLAVNVYLFTSSFQHFKYHEAFVYSRVLVGEALPWAKSAAQCLNLNSALLIIPACRRLVTHTRDLCGFRVIQRQLDKSISFHMLVAYAIVLFTGVHVTGHVLLWERCCSAWRENATLSLALSQLGQLPNETYLNPVRARHRGPLRAVVSSLAGVSGVLGVLALVLTTSSSRKLVRSHAHLAFYHAHRLAGPIYFLTIVIHGLG
ncbi:NADPH oxidase 3-like [Petromyzon marinus]|uniref:NADPH oxidase 3-like n=1 Tax=Petromyzon marinus TaxID=7757 RepID=UPI003F6F1ABA